MTKRNIIRIDEEKCNGCGLCIPSCKEGALKIVNGKAKLVSEVYCDGLGACLGECPQGALTIEEREADEFNEELAMAAKNDEPRTPDLPCGCPGTMARTLKHTDEVPKSNTKQTSELRQWPIQLHLIPMSAPYLKGADLVLLADCTAVAYANLHNDFIRGKIVAMACPKLDDTSSYAAKLAEMIKINNFRTIEVVMMEVPCCHGLGVIVEQAVASAGTGVRLMKTTISLEGNILTN